MPQVQRPDTNLGDLERVEDVHGHRVRALVGEVAANSAAQSLERLPHVDGFAVVVVEGINTPLAIANVLPCPVDALKERLNLPANSSDIRRKAGLGPFSGGWLSGRRLSFRETWVFLVGHNLLPKRGPDSCEQSTRRRGRKPRRQNQTGLG